jgi:ribosomal protein S12 methylthiotransferase
MTPNAPDNSSAAIDAPAAAVRTVALVSLGCPKNLVDSETMLAELRSAGLQLVSDHDDADAIIINTCGFLEASKDESLDAINEAVARKTTSRTSRVVVAGCLVQRHRAKILGWAPGIDAMIGVFDRDHIVEAVRGASPEARRSSAAGNNDVLPKYWIAGNALQAARQRGVETVGLTVRGNDGRGVGYFEDESQRLRLTPRHWAYLRVSEGCNQKCAFCTIPSIRGKMRSKPLDRILSEARQLMADGAFELNLIGQDTTSYGSDIYGDGNMPGIYSHKPGRSASQSRVESPDGYTGDLIGLLTGLNDVAAEFGGGWMRLMYVYPTYFTDAMIDAIAALPNIVKYIDIPLQHVSDRMLSAMRRNITGSAQKQLLYKLRERIPGLAVRTTLITGFPGETDDDHRELVEFIDEFGFDMLGVFRYSHEGGTPAGTMDDDPALHVPDSVKAEREAELMLTQQQLALDNAQYLAEQRCQFDVLIDRPVQTAPDRSNGAASADRAHRYEGRCYHQAPQVDSATYVLSDVELSPGELVRCTILETEEYDLVARPTDQLERKIRLPVV